MTLSTFVSLYLLGFYILTTYMVLSVQRSNYIGCTCTATIYTASTLGGQVASIMILSPIRSHYVDPEITSYFHIFIFSYFHIVVGVMKMGNIVPRTGIEPRSLAFRTSLLTITPPKLVEVTTGPTPMCLSSPLASYIWVHDTICKLKWYSAAYLRECSWWRCLSRNGWNLTLCLPSGTWFFNASASGAMTRIMLYCFWPVLSVR